MRVMKYIILLPFNFIKITLEGAIHVCILTTKGFYSYFVWLIRFVNKLFHIEFLNNLEKHFEERKSQPECFLLTVACVVFLLSIFNIFLLGKSLEANSVHFEKVLSDKNIRFDENSYTNEELNVFKKYEKYLLKQVDIKRLKKINKDTVCWLNVSGTRINYPIVQAYNNDFYFENNYDKHSSSTGWPFMDYRNSSKINDDNTIFYGKSLTYGMNFGDLDKLFDDKNSRDIVILTNRKKYTYKLLSVYKTPFSEYFLINNFTSADEKEKFFEDIKSKSVMNYNVDVDYNDRIITLATNSSDNLWIVAHAVLVSDEKI